MGGHHQLIMSWVRKQSQQVDKTRAMYDRYNIVHEGDISMALTQTEAYRARRGYNLATSEGAQQRRETLSKL